MAEGIPEENSFSQNGYLKFLPLVLFFGGLFFLSVAAGTFFLKSSTKSDDIQIISADTNQNVGEIVVHVDGAVNKPGVYSLPSDSRVRDAIESAGGLSSDADSTRVNLAAKITDGQKLLVPKIGESVSVQGAVADETSVGLININTATEGELDKLPGIGPVTAAKIIASRPYSSSEDLLTKKAVSASVYGKIKDLISF